MTHSSTDVHMNYNIVVSTFVSLSFCVHQVHQRFVSYLLEVLNCLQVLEYHHYVHNRYIIIFDKFFFIIIKIVLYVHTH